MASSEPIVAPERMPKEIKKWMIDEEINGADLSRRSGLSLDSVSKTIRGYRNSPKILRVLIDLGCPVEFLGLPEDSASRVGG